MYKHSKKEGRDGRINKKKDQTTKRKNDRKEMTRKQWRRER
jgi:hypothetical protein